MEASSPTRTEETVMSAVTPITTPSTVRRERILFSRRLLRAIRAFSPRGIPMVSFPSLLAFLAHGFDGVELRGLLRGINSKKQSDQRLKNERHDYRCERN